MSTAPYRVGRHYGLHVYQGDRPVATFHDADEAARFVAAANDEQRDGYGQRQRERAERAERERDEAVADGLQLSMDYSAMQDERDAALLRIATLEAQP